MSRTPDAQEQRRIAGSGPSGFDPSRIIRKAALVDHVRLTEYMAELVAKAAPLLDFGLTRTTQPAGDGWKPGCKIVGFLVGPDKTLPTARHSDPLGAVKELAEAAPLFAKTLKELCVAIAMEAGTGETGTGSTAEGGDKRGPQGIDQRR